MFLNRIIRAPLLLAMLVVVNQQGCANDQQQIKTHFEPNTVVRLQVCVPNKRVYFKDIELDKLENHPNFTKYSLEQLNLAPKKVRRVDSSINDPKAIGRYWIGFNDVTDHNGIGMAGRGAITLRNSTVSNQPVFGNGGYGAPPQDYLALGVDHINTPNRDRMIYLYKLPENIPVGKFTGWFNPISKISRNDFSLIRNQLFRGKKIETSFVPIDSPKMRFLLEDKQKKHKHNDPTVDNLPALTTARKYYGTASTIHEFVKKADEKIPSCD